MASPIPITVLTGYLGAGKTTLLNYLLTHNEGVKFGVVVNDFGDVNIDAQLVEKQTDTALQLTNGCICCSMDLLGLEDALKQFVYPDSPITYILIEASGLAESADLVSNLGSRVTKELGVYLDGVVCVIDAEHIEQNAKEYKTAASQIEHANFVIINKTDLVPSAKIADIRTMITMIKPKARIIETTHGAIDLHLILNQDALAHTEEIIHDHPYTSSKTKGDTHHHNHEHHHFSQLTWIEERPLDPVAFQRFVNQLLPTNIYRAKGFVNMGQKVRGLQCVFQLVGSRATITWEEWGDRPPKTQLVFIGQDFDQNQLRQHLVQCLDPNPNAANTAGLPIV